MIPFPRKRESHHFCRSAAADSQISLWGFDFHPSLEGINVIFSIGVFEAGRFQ